MSSPVHDLRRLLERRFPDALPIAYGTTEVVGTGVPGLDALLPGGGLPRGRLTTWMEGGGATALLRAACEAAAERGERTAWVDGRGLVEGESWCAGPVLLRPPDPVRALECAEVLLRSGGFALVVVTGAPAGESELLRLARVAREGGGALVVVGGRSSGAVLDVASRIPPDGWRWRSGLFGPAEVEAATVVVRVRALGLERRATLDLPVETHEHRLSLEPELADRRGTPRRAG